MDDDGQRRYSQLLSRGARDQRSNGKTRTRAEAPALPLEADFWKSARVVMPTGKASVHLRLDNDVLEWFRAQGKGHLSRMNAVLRSYMDAHREPGR